MTHLKIENTSNKNIIKFIADRPLVKGSYELTRTSNDLKKIPLAQELFQFPFVESVFITANFIALNKIETVEWNEVQDELLSLIQDELLSTPSIVIEENSPLSIYIEMTPNQDVMKFVSDKKLVDGIIEVTSKEEATQVPIAEYLFSFPYVKEVFISNNFISITKINNISWEKITTDIRSNISTYIKEGKTISLVDNLSPQKGKEKSNKEYSDIENKIRNILAEYVIPAVASDGGNIELISFDEKTKTAKMLLQGACSGCPSATITLKNGIETLLKEMLPAGAIELVEAIND